MTKLANYFNDGANVNAQAVICMLKDYDESLINELDIARWENGREQGYVLSLRLAYNNQMNINVFRHRNCDDIHCNMWPQWTFNSPTIKDVENCGTYPQGKWNTSFRATTKELHLVAEWIFNMFDEYKIRKKNVEKISKP